MKPSDCFFISLENIETFAKKALFFGKKFRKKQYDGFPHFFNDFTCFEVTWCLLQASVFALWIDCPPIGLVINNCQIVIYVPGGFLQF